MPNTRGDPTRRRLAAVLLADVVGYSALMERDDAGTHERLRRLRDTITDPAVAAHHGRIVRSRGDDLLAEFPSAHQAFECAVAIQRALLEQPPAAAGEPPMQLRIGLSLGDVLADGDDIAGDGVNLAARLQALAQPGAIALSAAVRDQLGARRDVVFVDAGEAALKNLSRPVRWFHAQPATGDGPGPASQPAAALAQPAARRAAAAIRVMAAAALIGAIAAGAALMREAAPDSGAQTMAMLPTRAAPGPATALLARELDAELAGALAQGLGAGGRLVRLAEDHDARAAPSSARYLVAASVLTADGRASIELSVTRTSGGTLLWNTKLQAPAGAGMATALVEQIADALLDRLRLADIEPGSPGLDSDPVLLTLRAQTLLPSGDPEHARMGFELLDRALRARPDFAPALATLAEMRAYAANRAENAAERDRLLREADELSLRAMARASGDAAAWRARAQVLQIQGRIPAAQEAIEQSLRLYRYSSVAHGTYGLILTSADRLEDALVAFDRAVQLNPASDSLGVHLYHRCRTELFLGRYLEAIESCRRSTAYMPDWLEFVALAAALAMAGAMEEARAEVRKLLKEQPGMTLQRYRTISAPLGPRADALRERTLYEGLRRAGLPER